MRSGIANPDPKHRDWITSLSYFIMDDRTRIQSVSASIKIIYEGRMLPGMINRVSIEGRYSFYMILLESIDTNNKVFAAAMQITAIWL